MRDKEAQNEEFMQDAQPVQPVHHTPITLGKVLQRITVVLLIVSIIFIGVTKEARAEEDTYSYVEQAKEYLGIDVLKMTASEVDTIIKGVEHTFSALSTGKITKDISETNRKQIESISATLIEEVRGNLQIPAIKSYKTYLMDNGVYYVKVKFTYGSSLYSIKATANNGVVYTSNLDWLFEDIANNFCWNDTEEPDDIVVYHFNSDDDAEDEVEADDDSTTGFIAPGRGE